MKPIQLSREFDTAWPAVLVEIKDFIDLARLSCAGDYAEMKVNIVIAKTIPAEWLNSSPVSPFGQFRAMLDTLPRCRVGYSAAEQPAHRVDIAIQR
jgi:hypothetical protein